ncbi:MAG: hypothetical protein U9Q80_07525 [Bacillota bacterium]|nr:hypothetical protein [Bacillota bacterium]
MIDVFEGSILLKGLRNCKKTFYKSRTYEILKWDLKDRVIWAGKDQKGTDVVETSCFIRFLKNSRVYNTLMSLFEEE